MNYIPEDEVKSSIRSYLQGLITETNSDIYILKNLANQLNFNEAQSQNYINQDYTTYAYSFSKNAIIKENQLKLMYELSTKIITKLLGLRTLSYTIYYKTDNGQILRLVTNNMTKAAHFLFNDKSLMITGSDIASAFSNELNELRQQTEYTQNLTRHYEEMVNLLQGGQKKYFPETFERDMLNYPHSSNNINSFMEHKWTKEEAWNYYHQSTGNDPWYSGGDILSQMFNVQVKGYISGSEQGNTKFSRLTTLTSQSSILNIINYLVTLLDVNYLNLDNKVNEIFSTLCKRNEYETLIEEQINLTSEDIIEKNILVENI